MKITEKINLDLHGLMEHGPINIVVFGDSVTHGCFGMDEIDYDAAYWNKLRKKINSVRDYVPVNVINAGIGGVTARTSLLRMDKQVLAHNPDLIIICFGLNDVNCTLDDFLTPLGKIFEKAVASGADVIYMTPNSFNTSHAPDTPEKYFAYAKTTMEYQLGGRMDTYMEAAIKLANEKGVIVCDCYAKWNKLAETQDVTYLLANRINHPKREMHELFAQSLFDIIFEGTEHVSSSNESTMFESK